MMASDNVNSDNINSISYKKLNDFLNKNKIIKKNTGNNKFTHTSLENPKSSFDFSGEKHTKFIDLYCTVVSENKNNLYITEGHLIYSPFLIDIDLKYNLFAENNNHRYTISNIEYIIKIYNKYIELFLNVDSENYKAYLLEKSTPSLIYSDETNFKYKDGVHIIYPLICVPSNIQFVIRNKVIEEIKKSGDLDSLLMGNDIKDVFDEAVIERNNWLMYGSCKPGYEKQKYILTRIYNKDLSYSTIDDLSSSDIKDLPKTLSIRRFDEDDLADLNNDYTWDRIDQLYQNMNLSKKKRNMDDIRIARRLVSMLTSKRHTDFQKWIELGWCLHNIHDSLVDIWIEFSKSNGCKFKEGDCENRWKTFRDNGYTIKSLYRWAREDNPSLYSEFVMEENGELMKRSLTGTNYDVAKVFYEIYKDEYVCSSIKNKTWHEFNNHKWVTIDNAYTIYGKLNEEMCDRYLNMGIALSVKALRAEGDEKTNLISLQDKCIGLCKKLRGTSFKKQVLEELINLFFDPEFSNNMDEKRNLLCFKNGVYDLENDIFREGRPEDYITLCTNNNYYPYDANDPNIIKVLQFLADIQPDEDMKDYIIDLMASCLQGHIPDEKFHIWTGSGGNGKSVSINLLMNGLGDYACSLPITMLTSKRPSATCANPEMAKTKGKRFCVFQEPEQDDKIHVGYMKEITSNNDKVSARGLFKEPVEFYPQFKLILTCNILPDIPASDGGTWRRVRVVEFEMKFVDNPKAPNERKKNAKFNDDFPALKEALMSLLIERFKQYKINGLKEPTKVTTYTANYQKNSDKYLEFIDEALLYTGNKQDVIGIKKLYGTYKYWYKESYNEKTNISQRDLKTNLVLKLESHFNTKGKLVGYQIIPDEDAEEIGIIEENNDNNDINSNTITISQNNTNLNMNKNKHKKNNGLNYDLEI